MNNTITDYEKMLKTRMEELTRVLPLIKPEYHNTVVSEITDLRRRLNECEYHPAILDGRCTQCGEVVE